MFLISHLCFTVVDNSGIRLYYTDILRKHDGGVFVTGTVVSPLSIIPPYQEAYKTAGYCDRYCTKTVSETRARALEPTNPQRVGLFLILLERALFIHFLRTISR